ncbi:preprotein translocase subunit SecG [Buchnera aphidicola (Diuraphis noxia)]|uniref:Protein-export membrane protein SecG n=1 Tax=Buchnera aphidicola subsp. Diuraphis noxia TaxID=118101 RepID=A0A1B2H8P2_BUCDN|nr:preprotein translocase subunit SecG [Buchnera aphidicola (Diuraphis noxia)]
MYLFFLVFFILISFFLIFLILSQSGKGLHNTLNITNNVKYFNNIGTNNFITNIISVLTCIFFIISIILCNINTRKMDIDFFIEKNVKNIETNESILKNK